jgi:hypothetical protein
VFSVFPWSRAVPGTPEEPTVAFVIVLFPVSAAFARSEGARPPLLCDEATYRFTRFLRPASSLLPGFGGDLAVPCAPPASFMR